MENKYDFIVVGGGASGLMAAGRAAELGVKVLVLEKMKKPAIKLSMTGKGRCNITNSLKINEFIKKIKPDGRFLRQAFNRFFNDDTVEFFTERGVAIQLERGGRYFPKSGNAHEIVNILLDYCYKNRVKIVNNKKAQGLIVENGVCKGVKYSDIKRGVRSSIRCENILVAVGGNSYHSTGTTGDGYKLAGEIGHEISKIFPSLVPVDIETRHIKQFYGLHLKNVNLSLWQNGKKIDEQFGEMEFNNTGVTGPIVLKLSRQVSELSNEGKKLFFKIDLKPAVDIKKLDVRLANFIQENSKKTVYNFFKNFLPQKLIKTACIINELDPGDKVNVINKDKRKKIRNWMKSFLLEIKSVRPINEAIVTAGGVNLKEVNPKTMESRIVKGVYFSGEILNIDADTGGFNLQAAFSTGVLAAEAVYLKITESKSNDEYY